MATTAPEGASPEIKTSYRMHKGDPPLVGDLTEVPTFYVDDLKGVMLRHGVVKLTFSENQLDHTDNQLKTRLVLNVAIGADALPAFLTTLESVRDDIAQGMK